MRFALNGIGNSQGCAMIREVHVHNARRPEENGHHSLCLEEFTHRTLNDYTVMLSVLGCAAQSTVDETAQQAFREIELRLRGAAAVAKALRPRQQGHLCNVDEDLEVLCSALVSFRLCCRGIKLTLSLDSVVCETYRCWQILLVVSELVTNAARHAFSSHDGGAILVTMKEHDGCVELRVADDGVASSFVRPGQGTTIINTLVADLDGTITRNYSSAGSIVTIRIPLSQWEIAANAAPMGEIALLL